MQAKLKSTKENTFIGMFLIGFIILIIVFFTSKMWLYDDNPIQQTPFNERIETLQQTTLILTDWKYNHKKNFMEVVIEKDFQGEDSIPPTYDFKASDTELNEDFSVKVMHETDNLFVIHILNVPEDYRFIRLEVIEIRDKEVVRAEKEEELLSDQGSSVQLEDIDDKELEDSNFTILLGDYREIEVDNSIHLRSEIEYEISNTELQKDLVKKEIKVIKEDKIPLEERAILEQEKKIEELKEELEFSSGEEKEELEILISDREGTVVKSFEKIEEYEERIEDLEEKIKALDRKLDSLKSDKNSNESKNTEKETDDKKE